MTQPFDSTKHDQFLRLVAEHQAALHNFIRTLIPDRAEASEVLQDVTVVLWQKFDTAVDFKKWAFGVARMEVLKYRQSRARDRHVFDDELTNKLADEVILREPIHLTQREALDDCLKKLPDEQRELALSAYTKGTSVNDLASRLGKTPMALYKLLQRIRQSLLKWVRHRISQEGSI